MCQTIRENMPTVNAIIEKFNQFFDLGESLRTDSALWQQILGTVIPMLNDLDTAMTVLPGPMGSVLSILGAIVPTLSQVTNGFEGQDRCGQCDADRHLGGQLLFRHPAREKARKPLKTAFP